MEDGHQSPGCSYLLQAAGVDKGVQEGCAVLTHTVVGQATYRQPLQHPERLQCTRCDAAELRLRSVKVQQHWAQAQPCNSDVVIWLAGESRVVEGSEE